jgi:hypothetical protein
MSGAMPRSGTNRATQTVAGVILWWLGSGLMIAATFLPWIKAESKAVSGYDIWDVQNRAGENPFFTMTMFGDFSPFVTGLTTLLAGMGWAPLVLLVLAVPKVPPPSRAYLPRWLSILVMLPLILVTATMGLNLSAITSHAAAAVGVSIESGLLVLAGGTVLAVIGLAFATSRPGAPMLRPALPG